MSNDKDPKELAKEIYLGFCEESGPDEWDWQKLANRAYDAVEAFETVSNQRIEPQKSVPSVPEQPEASPTPLPP